MFTHILFSVTAIPVAIFIKPTFLPFVKYIQYKYVGCGGQICYWKQRFVIYISFMLHFRPPNCLLFTSYGQFIFTRNVNVPSAMSRSYFSCLSISWLGRFKSVNAVNVAFCGPVSRS